MWATTQVIHMDALAWSTPTVGMPPISSAAASVRAQDVIIIAGNFTDGANHVLSLMLPACAPVIGADVTITVAMGTEDASQLNILRVRSPTTHLEDYRIFVDIAASVLTYRYAGSGVWTGLVVPQPC